MTKNKKSGLHFLKKPTTTQRKNNTPAIVITIATLLRILTNQNGVRVRSGLLLWD